MVKLRRGLRIRTAKCSLPLRRLRPFTQKEAETQNIDLLQLATELETLRNEMKKQAVDAEQDIAVSDIAKAEQAAKSGDSSKGLEHLKSAGRWAFDVATKIGTSLAVEMIEKSSGLKP